jgi:hypothetical protein
MGTAGSRTGGMQSIFSACTVQMITSAQQHGNTGTQGCIMMMMHKKAVTPQRCERQAKQGLVQQMLLDPSHNTGMSGMCNPKN